MESEYFSIKIKTKNNLISDTENSDIVEMI